MAFVRYIGEFSLALGFSRFNIISAENSTVFASLEESPQLGTEPDLLAWTPDWIASCAALRGARGSLKESHALRTAKQTTVLGSGCRQPVGL